MSEFWLRVNLFMFCQVMSDRSNDATIKKRCRKKKMWKVKNVSCIVIHALMLRVSVEWLQRSLVNLTTASNASHAD